MKDLVLSARRGVECLLVPPVAVALFGTGAAWTVANGLLGWLVLGPALVALFRIAVKGLRGEEPSFKDDNMAVLADLPTALVAGILFALPFKLWSMLHDFDEVVKTALDAGGLSETVVTPGIPVTASAALFVHFALFIFVFPVVAERHAGLLEAARTSAERACRTGRDGSHFLGLGRHLLYTSAILAVILLAARAWSLGAGLGGVFTALIGPPAVMILASWYLRVSDDTGDAALAAEALPDPGDDL